MVISFCVAILIICAKHLSLVILRNDTISGRIDIPNPSRLVKPFTDLPAIRRCEFREHG